MSVRANPNAGPPPESGSSGTSDEALLQIGMLKLQLPRRNLIKYLQLGH